jgi:hypothetical protein
MEVHLKRGEHTFIVEKYNGVKVRAAFASTQVLVHVLLEDIMNDKIRPQQFKFEPR